MQMVLHFAVLFILDPCGEYVPIFIFFVSYQFLILTNTKYDVQVCHITKPHFCGEGGGGMSIYRPHC